MVRFIFGIVLINISSILAQSNQQFNIRFNEVVNGNIVMIGNGILNRGGSKENPNSAYDDVSSKAELNDVLNMQYIDIDANDKTFSSSSAKLMILSDKGFELKYAGLYWAATYPYKSGVRNRNGEYETDKTRESPKNVLLKLPSNNYYSPISGEIVFDGFYAFNDLNFKGTEPYVAYADVTNLVKNQTSIQGEYFVANVLAATGDVKGGSCAGWVMIFVYEENGASSKRITTYDGFTTNNLQLKYSDFTTPDKANTKARILGAAIEGDLNVVGDKVIGHFPKSGTTFFLADNIKRKDDFFNSSITKNNDYFLERNPKSKNTLGFDLYDIDFTIYQSVPKDETELDIKLIATSDKIFHFLNALVIETSDGKIASVSSPTPPPTTSDESSANKEAMVNTDIKDSEALIEVDVRDMEINNADMGYYNVVGVYYNSVSVIKLIDKLNKKGYQTNYIFDDKTYYHYIYTNKTSSFDDAVKNREKLNQDPETKGSWILSIRNES